MASPDLLSKCSLAVWSEHGERFLGTGTLVAADKLLTCSHVVSGSERFEVRRELNGERVSWATLIGEPGNPESAHDLALLRLETSLHHLGWIRFDDHEPGQDFQTAGFTARGRHPVFGKITRPLADFRGWLEIDASGTRKIEQGCSGSAAWVENRKRAVGLVAYKGHEGLAYIIPTSMIREFWPDLPAPTPRRAQIASAVHGRLKLPNVGVSRAVRLVETASKKPLGQGVRLDAEHVLTVAVVRAAADGVSLIGGRTHGESPETEAHAVADDPWAGAGLCLLRSPTFEALSPLEHHAADIAAEAPWRSAVWLETGQGGHRRIVVGGRVGERNSASGRRQLKLASSIEAAGLASCRGAGVFVDPEGCESWRLAGALSLSHEGDEPCLELVSLEQVSVEGGLSAWLGHDGHSRDGLERGIEDLARDLEVPGVAEAIRESRRIRRADSGGPAEDFASLARALVESDVNDLAADVANAHRRVLLKDEPEIARHLRDVFERAVPLALRQSAGRRFPDRSAVDVRIDFFDEVLVELNLAAADEGPAGYLPRPASEASGRGRPVSPYAIDTSGNYGPDLGHLGQAADQLEGLTKRFILDGAGENEELAKRFLTRLASSEGPDNEPIVGRAQLIHLDRTARSDPETQTRELLKMINEGAGNPTSVGRRLYVLLTLPDDMSGHEAAKERGLVEVLKQLLPDLRVVERGADEASTARRYRRFSSALHRIYGERRERRETSES